MSLYQESIPKKDALLYLQVKILSLRQPGMGLSEEQVANMVAFQETQRKPRVEISDEIQFLQLRSIELKVETAKVIPNLLEGAAAKNGDDVIPLSPDPVDRDLRGRATDLTSNLCNSLSRCQLTLTNLGFAARLI